LAEVKLEYGDKMNEYQDKMTAQTKHNQDLVSQIDRLEKHYTEEIKATEALRLSESDEAKSKIQKLKVGFQDEIDSLKRSSDEKLRKAMEEVTSVKEREVKEISLKLIDEQ
jgi:translation elongation factor EF-Tu-like GTPase